MRTGALIAVLLLAHAATAAAAVVPGEVATFRLRWSFVTVGTVEIRTTREGAEGGWVFNLTASTNPWMDRFLRARTWIESRTGPEVESSLGYVREERHADPVEVHETLFAPDGSSVRYSRNGDTRAVIPLAVPAHDPLSIVFAIRRAGGLRPGVVLRIPVTDGQVVEEAVVEVIESERIRVPAGRMETWRLRADLGGVRGVFARPEGADIEIWLSKDERLVPVRLKSRTVVGSFSAELEEVTEAP